MLHQALHFYDIAFGHLEAQYVGAMVPLDVILSEAKNLRPYT